MTMEKLEKEVEEIRMLHDTGFYTQDKLSELFNIKVEFINNIINNNRRKSASTHNKRTS